MYVYTVCVCYMSTRAMYVPDGGPQCCLSGFYLQGKTKLLPTVKNSYKYKHNVST